jgi:hypothetical protein
MRIVLWVVHSVRFLVVLVLMRDASLVAATCTSEKSRVFRRAKLKDPSRRRSSSQF